MEDYFSLFLDEFGRGESVEVADEGFFAKYANRLPENLLSFIRAQGFSAYAGGRFWTLNPDKLSGYVQRWCDLFPSLAGKEYYAFARSAFGDVYAVQQGSGKVIHVAFVTGTIWVSKTLLEQPRSFDAGIESFFGSSWPADYDLEDDGVSLFEKGTERFGALNANELFGFEHAIVLGGEISLQRMKKLRMDVHIDILAQLAHPVIQAV